MWPFCIKDNFLPRPGIELPRSSSPQSSHYTDLDVSANNSNNNDKPNRAPLQPLFTPRGPPFQAVQVLSPQVQTQTSKLGILSQTQACVALFTASFMKITSVSSAHSVFRCLVINSVVAHQRQLTDGRITQAKHKAYPAVS